MDKKERRIFARRYKAAAQLNHCLETRFIETLTHPFDQVKDARDVLDSIELIELRKRVELYAAARLHRDRLYVMRRLQYDLQVARDLLDRAVKHLLKDKEIFSEIARDPRMRSTPIPTTADLLDDIKALEREFPKWQLCDDEFVVTTESIVLTADAHSVDLGQFEIRLDLDALERGVSVYRIVALSPNMRENHIHPHVSSDRLCEGAAEYPIKNALANGLIYDFFLIVYNTLSEYNSQSPYVKLEHWTGDFYDHDEDDEDNEDDEDDWTYCAICDARVLRDEACSCNDCGSLVCSMHASYCATGDTMLCTACLTQYQDQNAAVGRPQRSCCRQAGAHGCRLHVNLPCVICGESPSDIHKITCQLSGDILCHVCADTMVRTEESCNGCETAGHARCALIPFGLPVKQKEADETKEAESTEGAPGVGQVVQAILVEGVVTSSGEREDHATG